MSLHEIKCQLTKVTKADDVNYVDLSYDELTYVGVSYGGLSVM